MTGRRSSPKRAVRAPRSLSADDRALWEAVKATARPLSPQRRCLPDTDGESEAAGGAESGPSQKKGRGGRIASPARVVTRPPKPAPPPAPPLAPLERKLTQRLGRGSVAVDARIDLHGLRQNEAHERLFVFLADAQTRGHALVLVITGKGRAGSGGAFAEAEPGVLRRAVPQWLALPRFRALVVGFSPAGPRHGGAGALYVRLRKAAGKVKG